MAFSLPLVLLFPVVLVSLLYPRWLGDRVSVAMMLPVLGFSLWEWVDWTGLHLWSQVQWAAGGVFAGWLLFLAGLPITTESPMAYLKKSASGLRRFASWQVLWPTLLYQVVVIFYEETIWRLFLVGVLGAWLPLPFAVVIASSLFWFSHAENREVAWHSVEFYLFSMALTAIFAVTGSLALVCVIHGVRNLLILMCQVEDDRGQQLQKDMDERTEQ